VVFTYLKTAHDQTPADKNDGNPANWAWNPIDWFKKSDDPSAPPSPAVTISIGYTPGGGVTAGGGIGNPVGPVPMFGYSSGGGPSVGVYNNGLTSWYSSGNNPSAPEQNANRAIESAREAAYSNEIWATTFFPPAGTQVMEPLSGWGMVGNLILGPRTYNGRTVDWDGRITANHAPITGMAPTPGFKGGSLFGNAAKWGKTLQTGGHTLNNSTLKALGLTKEQGKNAIEALKKANGLRNNTHYKIMSNGDLVNPHTGQIIDNILHYIY
jgi:hypothetical protein